MRLINGGVHAAFDKAIGEVDNEHLVLETQLPCLEGCAPSLEALEEELGSII